MSYSEINESKIIQPSYDEDNEYKDNNCKVNFSSLMNNHSLIKSQNPFTKSQRDKEKKSIKKRDKGEESIIVTNSKHDNVIKYEGVEDQSCGCNNCLNNNNVVVTIGSGSAENVGLGLQA